MSGPTVLVVGESLTDVVIEHGRETRRPGGSPMNVACGLARLGRPSRLLTRIGRDADGDALRDHLAGSGVDLIAESVTDEPTSTAVATIERDGSASYAFDVEWSLPLAGDPGDADWLHVGSIATFLRPGADAVEHLLREAAGRVTVSYDPNIRPALIGDHREALERFERICGLSAVVKLSDEDAGWLYPGHPLDAVFERLLTLGPTVVAMTGGAAAASVATATATARVEPPHVAVVDTIGAGDSFMATLVAELLDADLASLDATAVRRAARRATVAAALTCTRAGAQPPTAAELDAAFGRA